VAASGVGGLEWSGGGWVGKRSMANWVAACDAEDIEVEDVIRFDHDGRTFAVYRSPEDEYFATDGLCTHEQVHLADGLVMGTSSNARSTTAASTIGPVKPSALRSASILGPTRSRSTAAGS
jgi:hypothetical protein